MDASDVRKSDPEGWFALERVLLVYPEFRTQVEVRADADAPYFFVRLPAPVPTHPDLLFYTMDGELTLAFDRWHCHYNYEEIDSFLQKLDDILAERAIIAVKMKGDEWGGSTSFNAGEQPSSKFLSLEGDIYYRSWNGSYDFGKYPPPEINS